MFTNMKTSSRKKISRMEAIICMILIPVPMIMDRFVSLPSPHYIEQFLPIIVMIALGCGASLNLLLRGEASKLAGIIGMVYYVVFISLIIVANVMYMIKRG